MIEIKEITLSEQTLTALEAYQEEIDQHPTFALRVAEAKRIWPSRKQNAPFREIREKLTRMCSGPRRCGYCEDSRADEIEHIWPKDFYPDKTFVWENYLYSCGPCNGPKGNQFALILDNEQEYTLSHPNTGPDRPPPSGLPLIIDPRQENPMDYLWLDIIDSFAFTTMSDDEFSKEYKRAEFTIDVLKLNERDDLVQGRKNAYFNYRARLTEYISKKDIGTEVHELELLKTNLQSEHHKTVWKEMQRQHEGIEELKVLFEQVPEALAW